MPLFESAGLCLWAGVKQCERRGGACDPSHLLMASLTHVFRHPTTRGLEFRGWVKVKTYWREPQRNVIAWPGCSQKMLRQLPEGMKSLRRKGIRNNFYWILLNCVVLKNPIASPLIGTYDKLTVLTALWRRGSCVKADRTARRGKFGAPLTHACVRAEDPVVQSPWDKGRVFYRLPPSW